MKIFVVEMLRWGDTETHHYIIGAFSTRGQAEEIGYAEECWRGGKYTKNIVEVEVDAFCKEILEYSEGC